VRLDDLYHGRSKAALRLRLILLAFDLIIISSYIVTSAFGLQRSFLPLDLALAAILLADISARCLIATSARDFLVRNPFHWADMLVILSLILPVLSGDVAFLRVLRALRGKLPSRAAFRM
jgi:voltage-gated potassium channel